MSERPRRASSSSRARTTTATRRWALGALGAEPVLVWHAETELPADTAAVVLPGGFSYGDYLRCGAIARVRAGDGRRRARSPPRAARCSGSATASRSSARRGCFPGVLRPNRQLEFVCRDVRSRSRARRALFTGACEVGQELVIPVKHGEGAWYARRRAARRARGSRPDRAPLRGRT